jgi:hypothetical protein
MYKEIFDLYPAAVFIIKKNSAGELSFVDLNQAAEKQFRVKRRQVMGMTLSDALSRLRLAPLSNILLKMAFDEPLEPAPPPAAKQRKRLSGDNPPNRSSVVIPLAKGAFAVCVRQGQTPPC